MDERDKILEEAKAEAAKILQEAKEGARQIYGASLEYAEDMLSEVNLIVLRGKELMRQQMEATLAEFDAKLDLLAGHKEELFTLLAEHTKEGEEPIKKAVYEIKVDEAYLPKEEAKSLYEIKIEDGEKKESGEDFDNEDLEGAYKASDFDLDGEYFAWLEEKENKHLK